MNRRQKIIVSVTGIFIVLLILIGLTYAYFLTRITGNGNPTSISVTTANLELLYGDGTTSILTSETPLMPSSTAIGTKDFTVTNNGDDSSYVVVFEDITIKYAADTVIGGQTVTAGTPTTFESNDFVYTLTCIVKDKNGNILNDKTCNGVQSRTFPMNGAVVVGNNIDKDDVHSYVLTLFYLDNGLDQSADMNKTLNGKINIKDIKSINPYSENEDSLAYNIINNSKLNKNGTELLATPLSKVAEEDTLVYGSGKYENVLAKESDGFYDWDLTYGDTPEEADSGVNSITGATDLEKCESVIGKYISDNDTCNYECELIGKVVDCENDGTPFIEKEIIAYEKVLSATQDDYGTSYYYRGAVTDNYVNFAGMCWKIVRIDGEGNTKLILEDQYAECDDTEDNDKNDDGIIYTGAWDIPASDGENLTMYGDEPYRTGNFGYDNSTYSGKNIASYLNPVTQPERSMVNAFKYFQNNNLSGYTSKLKSGNWCYNDTAYDDISGTTKINKESYYNDTFKTMFYYDSNVRLTGENNNIYNPTLNCNGTLLDKYKDNSEMYVGALTADEMMYAGVKFDSINLDVYLLNDYQSYEVITFLSLSPSYFSSTNDVAYYFSYLGTIEEILVRERSKSFRPAIVLADNTEITGGTGVISDPYIIK